jgi:hypothetical protein
MDEAFQRYLSMLHGDTIARRSRFDGSRSLTTNVVKFAISPFSATVRLDTQTVAIRQWELSLGGCRSHHRPR